MGITLVPVYAYEPMERTVYINDEEQGFTTVVHDGVEYISLNKLTEKIEYEFRWDGNTQTVTLWSPYRDIKVTVGSPYYYYNGFINPEYRRYHGDLVNAHDFFCAFDVLECDTYEEQYPPIILNNEVYIPILYIDKLFGCYSKAYRNSELYKENSWNIEVFPTYYDISIVTRRREKNFFQTLLTGEYDINNSKYRTDGTNNYIYPRGITDIWDPIQVRGIFDFWEKEVKYVYVGNEEDMVSSDELEGFNLEDVDRVKLKFTDKTSIYFRFSCTDEANARCFTSDYEQLTLDDMLNLTGKVVRYATQISKFVNSNYSPCAGQTPTLMDNPYYDPFGIYAVVLDKEKTRELEESKNQPINDEITVLFDGELIDFDQTPIIENGRTLVPMRAIFEAFGAKVDWDGDTKTVTAYKDDSVITLSIDDVNAYKNNELITLDVPARLINDRTMVPVRFIAESLDINTDWNGDLRQVILTTK